MLHVGRLFVRLDLKTASQASCAIIVKQEHQEVTSHFCNGCDKIPKQRAQQTDKMFAQVHAKKKKFHVRAV